MTDVPRETRVRLDRFVAMVVAENGRQNLVSVSSIETIESRHILDSLQLLRYCAPGTLVDIGTGAGFPGMVLACARTDPVYLVEPRRRRAEFLARSIDALDLSHVHVHDARVETLRGVYATTITARAVASLDALWTMAAHLADHRTRWVLPKGRSAQSELDTARASWQGEFELVASETDPEAAIVLATAVRRRGAR